MAMVLGEMRAHLHYARAAFPALDYCARVYWCSRCQQVDGAVAPAGDLPDAYECPMCGEPQEPVSPLLGIAANGHGTVRDAA